jgi:hypothetical protein
VRVECKQTVGGAAVQPNTPPRTHAQTEITTQKSTFGRHVEGVEADSAAAVDIGVIDGRREPNLGRLEWVPVRHQNLKLEGASLVRRCCRSLDNCLGQCRSKHAPITEHRISADNIMLLAHAYALAHRRGSQWGAVGTAFISSSERYVPASSTLSLPSRGHAETPGGGSSSWHRARRIINKQQTYKHAVAENAAHVLEALCSARCVLHWLGIREVSNRHHSHSSHQLAELLVEACHACRAHFFCLR